MPISQYTGRSIRTAALLALATTAASAFSAAQAGQITDPDQLRATLQAIADAQPGRLGLCAQDATGSPVCVNGDQPFSLQSVMKVVVGAAVMKAVDDGLVSLDDTVTIRREDLSVNIQPIADIVGTEGQFTTTIGDLVLRAVAESDSAATDVLIERLGGPAAVQAFLAEAEIPGIRIDRTERELQTETTGLSWDPSFVYPERLEAAREEVPEEQRRAAFEAYLRDERDTATPLGMTAFLRALADGELLSPASTEHFLDVMAQTGTFPDRLRAGVPDGWEIGHKTGTSQTYDGVNGVTNDVGIISAPDGGTIAIAAFLAGSTASADERAAVIANAARAVVAAYQ